jgi:hypothetical protein
VNKFIYGETRLRFKIALIIAVIFLAGRVSGEVRDGLIDSLGQHSTGQP